MDGPLICAEQVGRIFPKSRCVALRDVSLAVAPGEHLAIMGPSGSGKSTLLHILCGLDRPTTGRVKFGGVEPESARAWRALRARKIGFVFQAFNLIPTLTARQNVEIAMFGVLGAAKERAAKALYLLGRVGLSERADHRPAELSGGEKQRLAIARSLANSPAVILADEPTGNLDSKTSSQILDLLDVIRSSEGTALVVVTHDEAIAHRASRLICIRDGMVDSDRS